MVSDDDAEVLARLNLTANLWVNGLLSQAAGGEAEPLQIWIGTVGFVANDRLTAIGHRNSDGTEYWLLSQALDSTSSVDVHRLKQGGALTQAAFLNKAMAYFDCFYASCSETRPALTPYAHTWSQKAVQAQDTTPSCTAPADWDPIWDDYCP